MIQRATAATGQMWGNVANTVHSVDVHDIINYGTGVAFAVAATASILNGGNPQHSTAEAARRFGRMGNGSVPF